MIRQRLRIVAILAPALLIAGCGGTHNRGLESVHQPVVSRTDYVLDLQTSGQGLAAGENERLAGWLASLQTGYGDRLSIDDGGVNDPAARAMIAQQAGRYGLSVAETAPVTTGPVAPGTLRLVLGRMTAAVPGCPDYSRMYEPNYGQHTSSNHGCGVNSNLAGMVARPEDLVRGQAGSSVPDVMTSTKVIQAYRERPASPGTLPETRTTNSGAD